MNAAILAVLILILFAMCGVSPLVVFAWMAAIFGGWMVLLLIVWGRE